MTGRRSKLAAWSLAVVLAIPVQYLFFFALWQISGELPAHRSPGPGESFLCFNWFHGGDYYSCTLRGVFENLSAMLLFYYLVTAGLLLLVTAALIQLVRSLVARLLQRNSAVDQSR